MYEIKGIGIKPGRQLSARRAPIRDNFNWNRFRSSIFPQLSCYDKMFEEYSK